jgi:hypothetical protein
MMSYSVALNAVNVVDASFSLGGNTAARLIAPPAQGKTNGNADQEVPGGIHVRV